MSVVECSPIHTVWWISKRAQLPVWVTYNTPSFVPCIYAMRQRENAANASRDVDAGVFVLIHVMELAYQFQVESPAPYNFAPNLLFKH